MENHQQFSLKWNNYLQHISGAFDSLRTSEDFVDVTLSCEGKKIKAHKMLLSACSNYFREIFKENQCTHPVIVFHNIKFEDLSGLVTFMYQGQVNVEQECLQSFLNTAELLEVQGLTSPPNKNPKTEDEEESVSDVSSGGGKVGSSPPLKRKRIKPAEDTESSEPAIAATGDPVGDDMKEEEDDSLPLTPQFLLHQENSLTQDNIDPYATDSQYFTPIKEEPPDINTAIDPCGSSNDFQESLQDVDDAKDGQFMRSSYSLANSNGELNPTYLSHGVQYKMFKTEVEEQSLWNTSGLVQNQLENHPMQTGLAHICKVCGKIFKHAGSLSMHKRLHSGDTHCSLCGKVFSRMYYLKVHMHIHHKNELNKSASMDKATAPSQ